MTDYSVTLTTIPTTLLPIPPQTVIMIDTLLKAEPASHLESCEYLYHRHPEMYKEARVVEESSDGELMRYRLFLRAIDAHLCEFYNLLKRLPTFLDPYEAPYPILPLLAPLVGLEFNYDLPEDKARREVANAIFLWQRKGTRNNIADWIEFITGFRVQIREYYKEVLRTGVWGQAYAVSPSTLENRGGPGYATLPHLNEHHATGKWQGYESFFGFSIPQDSHYGTHGYTQLPLSRGGTLLPGFLFRNHIGVFIDVPDEQLDLTWYGQPYYRIIIDKINRIFDDIILYGVVTHLFWRIVSEEESGWCTRETESPYELLSCPAIDEEIHSGIATTGCLLLEDTFCGEGRLANILLCTGNPDRVTGAAGHAPPDARWVTWCPISYWVEYTDDILNTYIDNILVDSQAIPIELSDFEIYTTPYIGTGQGQGVDLACTISSWVQQNTESGEQYVQIIEEEWDNPYTETLIIADDWEGAPVLTNTLVSNETWNIDEGFADILVRNETWDTPETFLDVLVINDQWNLSEGFANVKIHEDDWEDPVPLTINDLEMWLSGWGGIDAESPLASWFDRSGNGHTASQVVTVARPDYNSFNTSFNRLGTVEFDGVNDVLTVPHHANFHPPAFSLVAVLQWHDNNDPGQILIGKMNNPNTPTLGWGLGSSPADNTKLRAWVNNRTLDYIDFSITVNETTIILLWCDGVTLEVFRNSVSVGSITLTTGLTNTTTPLTLGAAYSSVDENNATHYGQVTYAEVIWYTHGLTEEERSQLIDPLGSKYDVTLEFTVANSIQEEWEPSAQSVTDTFTETWTIVSTNEELEIDETWDTFNVWFTMRYLGNMYFGHQYFITS